MYAHVHHCNASNEWPLKSTRVATPQQPLACSLGSVAVGGNDYSSTPVTQSEIAVRFTRPRAGVEIRYRSHGENAWRTMVPPVSDDRFAHRCNDHHGALGSRSTGESRGEHDLLHRRTRLGKIGSPRNTSSSSGCSHRRSRRAHRTSYSYCCCERSPRDRSTNDLSPLASNYTTTYICLYGSSSMPRQSVCILTSNRRICMESIVKKCR